jgi:hypothetical protein
VQSRFKQTRYKPHGPFEAGHSPRSKLGQQLKESGKKMEAHSPSLDQLRKNTAERIRLAEEARTSAHKSFFIEMAERWVGLAEHAEKTRDR